MTRDLRALFDPASVAVLGASADPRKWGHWLALRALRGAHRRDVHLVNRRGEPILGHPVHTSLADLPAPVELVAIAVPDPALEHAVHDALAAGARAIIAITAGTADGRRDAALAAAVRAAGGVLVGPNCLGVSDSTTDLELVSNDLPVGEVALISQSGNLSLEIARLAERAGLGFSRFVSIGNQVDLSAAELIEDLTEHEGTHALALYIEDFRDGRDFARAAARIKAAGKPSVLLTVSGSAAARAARSHTGALASDRKAVAAVCAAAGIELVSSPRQMIDVLQGVLRTPPLKGARVAILADGGGHGGLATALASEAGLGVPELSRPTQEAISAQLPPTASTTNPIDLAGGGEQDISSYARVAEAVLMSGEVDALLLTGYFGGYAEYGDALARDELVTANALASLPGRSGRPLLVHSMYPDSVPAEVLRSGGVPVFGAIEDATALLGRLGTRAAHSHQGPIPRLPPAAQPVNGTDYDAARALLADGGVPFVAQRTVDTSGQAREAARAIGYPVALKALGRLHKSDGGGVHLDVADERALIIALSTMQATLDAERFSVEAMAPLQDGVELLVGVRWDLRFGPVALVGLGGIHTELLDDVAVALAPLEIDEAGAMLRRLRSFPLLDGARSRPRLDATAAAAVVAAVATVGAAHPEIAEIEINPLLVLPRGAVALDARIVPTNLRGGHTMADPSITAPTGAASR
jgi:acyl-CoA synthetase (NDP forming)